MSTWKEASTESPNGESETSTAGSHEHCTFTHLGESYFFITAGAAIEDVLAAPDESAPPPPAVGDSDAGDGHEADGDPEESTLEEIEAAPLETPNLKNSFCVTGSDMRFVATTRSLPGGTTIYVAKKLTAHQQRIRQDDPPCEGVN